jgi:hypothetical protein
MSEKIESRTNGSKEAKMEQLGMAFGLAASDFEEARSKTFWRVWMNRLKGKRTELLSFDDFMKRHAVHGQRSLGVMTVPVSHIVGSLGRAEDFDRWFMPRSDRMQERWVRVDRAFQAGDHLPPVELIKVGPVYFVVDGNHRVSVAKAMGQDYIDADVTEVDLPATVTAEMRVADSLDN